MNECKTAGPLHLFHHLVQLKKHGNRVISGLDCISGMADQAARSSFEPQADYGNRGLKTGPDW